MFKQILSAASLIAIASAVITSAPDCGMACIGSALETTTCDSTNVKCLCTSEDFIGAVARCLPTSCSNKADIAPTVAYANNLCQPVVGMDITPRLNAAILAAQVPAPASSPAPVVPAAVVPTPVVLAPSVAPTSSAPAVIVVTSTTTSCGSCATARPAASNSTMTMTKNGTMPAYSPAVLPISNSASSLVSGSVVALVGVLAALL